MEREFEQHILLREVSQLPEHIRQDVNMTAILGMIATEKVVRQAAEESDMARLYAEHPINLWKRD